MVMSFKQDLTEQCLIDIIVTLKQMKKKQQHIRFQFLIYSSESVTVRFGENQMQEWFSLIILHGEFSE